MISTLFSLLRARWQIVAAIVAAIAVAISLYSAGYFTARLIYKARISDQHAAYSDEQRIRAQEYAAALHARVIASDVLTRELLSTQKALTEVQQKLQRSISNAVSKDGNHFTGIGPDGLCIYLQAFGYECPESTARSNDGATSQTNGPG